MTLGIIVGLIIGAYFLYAIIERAVGSGVERALRNHHEWLQGEDRP